MWAELDAISPFVSLCSTGIKWAFDQLVDVHESKFSLARSQLSRSAPVPSVYCHTELKDYVLIARTNDGPCHQSFKPAA